MSFKLEIIGLKKIQNKIKKMNDLSPVKKIVKQNGAKLHQEITKNATFKKGYSTGATKKSISLEIEAGGLIARTGARTEYAPYLEYGTRKMSKQPFIKPAFNKQAKEFKKDMEDLV